MTVSPSIPATIEIRRSRLFGGALAVAAAAAAVTWGLLAFATSPATSPDAQLEQAVTRQIQLDQAQSYGRGLTEIGTIATGTSDSHRNQLDRAQSYGRGLTEIGTIATHGSAAQDARKVPSLMTLTPARLAAGALGTGYQLPEVHHGPTVESMLASMSPSTRRWTRAVMALTFRQLAAGAAGSP